MTISFYAKNRIEWFYQLARCLEIGNASVRVGLIFGTFLNEDRIDVRPGFKWLMATSGLSKATLSKAIDELEREGFLEVTDYGGDTRMQFGFPFDGDAVWKRERGHESPRMVQKLNRSRFKN